jgi:uncharacterized membrane protein
MALTAAFPSSLDSSDITKVGVGSTIAIVVIGLILLMVVGALIARVLIVIVVLVIAAFIWQQRSVIEDHVKNCQNYKSLSFFGFHIDTPKSVQDVCAQKGSLGR